jgi:hypothetical protein
VPDQVAITLPVEDGRPDADYVAPPELAERCGGLAAALGLPA